MDEEKGLARFQERCPMCNAGSDKVVTKYGKKPWCWLLRCKSTTDHMHAHCKHCGWHGEMMTYEQTRVMKAMGAPEKSASDKSWEELFGQFNQYIYTVSGKWIPAVWGQPTTTSTLDTSATLNTIPNIVSHGHAT